MGEYVPTTSATDPLVALLAAHEPIHDDGGALDDCACGAYPQLLTPDHHEWWARHVADALESAPSRPCAPRGDENGAGGV